jgi:hypothetical protein
MPKEVQFPVYKTIFIFFVMQEAPLNVILTFRGASFRVNRTDFLARKALQNR